MKRANLMAALQRLYPAISSNPIVDEMANFRFQGKSLWATDGQIMVRTELDEDTGVDCLIPAARFYKLLSSLSEDDVGLELKGDELVVKGRRVLGRYKVATEAEFMDSLDFEVDEWDDVPDGLLDGIKMCRFAVSNDVSRGVICGVLVSGGQAVGSNGFRIARMPVKGEADLVLSAELAGQVAGYGDKVDGFATKPGTALFRIGKDTVVAGKLLTGDYPDVSEYYDKADETLKSEVTFPILTSEVLKRHIGQQADVARADQEVVVAFGPDGLTVKTVGAGYELEEVVAPDVQKKKRKKPGEEVKAKEVAGVVFKVHPEFLLDILGRTRTMLYDDASPFIRFKSEDGFDYLATVERVE